MKYLNKHNTALDLSKLTGGELKKIMDLAQPILLDSEEYPLLVCMKRSITGNYKYFNAGTDELEQYGEVVDFDTFKSIHFPESTYPICTLCEKKTEDCICEFDSDAHAERCTKTVEPSSRRQEDGKPTYDELVEALSLFVNDFDQDLIEDYQIPRDRFEQLLERVK